MGRMFRFGKGVGMKVVGMPETFWVVTTPTANSELGDVCFQVDFRTYALQIRGGLEVESIVAIYSDGEAAKEIATKLIEVWRD